MMNASEDAPLDRSFLQPVNIFVGIVFLLTAIIGILLNGCVIFVLCKKHTLLLNPTTYFILTLTTLDLLMSVVNMPMVVVSSFVGSWIFGHVGCDFYGFTMTCIGLTIISVLTMISFDQYIVIVKTKLKAKRTRRIAKLVCMACSCWGLVWAVGPLIGWNSYVFTIEGVHTSCAINWKSKRALDLFYTMSIFVLCFLVPFAFICYFYSRIYLTVKSSKHSIGMSSIAQRIDRRQKYVSKTIFYMIGAFVLSWTPYAVVALWSAVGDATNIPNIVTIWPAVFAKISVLWNPLIYTFRNRDIKKVLNETFFKKSPQSQTI